MYQYVDIRERQNTDAEAYQNKTKSVSTKNTKEEHRTQKHHYLLLLANNQPWRKRISPRLQPKAMTRIRNFLLNRKGRPRAQLGKSPNEMPSEKQVDLDLDLPFLVRKL
jgi:hypothetical protein